MSSYPSLHLRLHRRGNSYIEFFSLCATNKEALGTAGSFSKTALLDIYELTTSIE
jgi:hypothetical protein